MTSPGNNDDRIDPAMGNSPAQIDIAHHVHGYTDLSAHADKGPFIITRAEGVRVFDDSGNSYIEGLAGLWCTSLGYSEKRLIDAATRAMETLPYCHGFAHMAAEGVIEFADRLTSVAPDGLDHVLFANSGSEATDLAVKLVWYYHNAIGKPEKKKIISRKRAYHGVTIASASLTGLPHLHADFDLPIDRILHTECPHHYHGAEPGENEEDFATRLAESLEAMIVAEGPETVGAMIAEPVMGAGGVIIPPKTYYAKIQAVLHRYNILLIADEVISGLCRTGNMWGSETMGLQPDMLTSAKQLSSAYLPISALLISDKVHAAMVGESEKLGIFGHGSTYGGHPVSAAVANETLKIFEERDIPDQVRAISPIMQQGLRTHADHPLVGEVRGLGLIAGIELIADKEERRSFDPKLKVGLHTQHRCREHGVLVRAIGDTLAVCPPLIIGEQDLNTITDAIGKALDETITHLEKEGLR